MDPWFYESGHVRIDRVRAIETLGPSEMNEVHERCLTHAQGCPPCARLLFTFRINGSEEDGHQRWFRFLLQDRLGRSAMPLGIGCIEAPCGLCLFRQAVVSDSTKEAWELHVDQECRECARCQEKIAAGGDRFMVTTRHAYERFDAAINPSPLRKLFDRNWLPVVEVILARFEQRRAEAALAIDSAPEPPLPVLEQALVPIVLPELVPITLPEVGAASTVAFVAPRAEAVTPIRTPTIRVAEKRLAEPIAIAPPIENNRRETAIMVAVILVVLIPIIGFLVSQF